ncbi:MAG: ABC transporter substrate-binding protein [Myxococcales bacterium]|nr:ABC transporter substrate-binding protein [Myxococcales bacterium]
MVNPRSRAFGLALACLLLVACRFETVSPGEREASVTETLSGEVWVYTSLYRHVIDALEPTLAAALPGVTIHWFQAGSEKVTARLEAELAGGGSPCDVLATSDPFLYERFKSEGRLQRYVSPNGLRTPSSYVDLDGHFAAVRLSTMVLVHRRDTPAPTSFEGLTAPEWRGEIALGDPLTSGTAFTWAVAMESRLGERYFEALRENGARVAGGNAAVLQKVEGGEAKVGVLLLENALAARRKGSPIEIVWPSDGAVVIPGYAGILSSTVHSAAARALVDALHSPEAQRIIAEKGDMHAVDPRVAGPDGAMALSELVTHSVPWTEALLGRGIANGGRVKAAFSKAFSR